MQSIILTNDHFKKINALLYKFIWNRHYLAAKAPERIKRDIMKVPVKLGGFGMLDLSDLDDGLKLRALSRTIDTTHPMLRLARDKINWEDFCNVVTTDFNEAFIKKGLQLLNKDRKKLGLIEALRGSRHLISLMGERKIASCISSQGKVSLAFHFIRRTGATRIKELNLGQFNSIERFVDRTWVDLVRQSVGTTLRVAGDDKFLYFDGRYLKDLRALSSKNFRIARESNQQICDFRIGLNLSPLKVQAGVSRSQNLQV